MQTSCSTLLTLSFLVIKHSSAFLVIKHSSACNYSTSDSFEGLVKAGPFATLWTMSLIISLLVFVLSAHSITPVMTPMSSLPAGPDQGEMMRTPSFCARFSQCPSINDAVVCQSIMPILSLLAGRDQGCSAVLSVLKAHSVPSSMMS